MTHSDSPFHAGEQQVQERLGVRDMIEGFARQVIRDHMPGQHRAFYAELPFVLLGALDSQGRPWASLLAGRPGFMTSPDPKRLAISARPLFGDPIGEALEAGAQVGLLGIELETRRRNRMAGRINSLEAEGFIIAVDQAFGNCPQYIQARAVQLLPEIDEAPQRRSVSRSDRFDPRSRALIERSDTLFIATAYAEDKAAVSQGVDVSHRGGKPGFVRVEDERHFLFPDFSGNNHFNTLGNIQLNPKAGFLFVDFERGDLLYMTGEAEIVWEGEELRAFAGAERLIRFSAEEVIRVEESLPLRFDFGTYSPMLEHTGSWDQARQAIAAEKERNLYLPYEVFDIEPESEAITSFYLRRADGKAPAKHEPGQFLPIRLCLPGMADPVSRTYTVSDAPNGDYYRLSVKREGGDAVVSNHLHDQAKPGFRLEAMAPRGKFLLDRTSERPVVLISAGVGITPMIAMANFIINEGLRTRDFRRCFFIHGARNGQVLAFGDHLRTLAAAHESLTTHIRFSQASDKDGIGPSHDSEGHVDIDLVKAVLPLDDYDFYLCGPQPFMQSLYRGLTGLGVREERIYYESFGPATLLKSNAEPKSQRGPEDKPVSVKFAGADVEAVWTPDRGTLLDLAEAAGLAPAFSCRSGICGTCATKLHCGQVDYIEEPSAPHGEGEVLLCCATPRSSTGEASCGEDNGVILGL